MLLTPEGAPLDERVLCIAHVVALANEPAIAAGNDPADSLIILSEESSAGERVWCVNYVPRNFRDQRGGGLIVYVDEAAGMVQRVVYCQ